MKALPSLLAVLLLLSSTSLAQTATSPQTAPDQAPAQQAPVQSTAPDQQAPAQQAPTQQTAMAQPTAPTPSTGTAAPSADVPPATAPAAAIAQLLAPGAKIFIEPMNGFDQDMVEAITRKKVPVVVVKQRAQADFVLSGEAHLKEHGWVAGNVLFPHGGVSIAINDARTGNVVFACKSKRVDAMTADGQIFQNWADGCAGHLKKAMKQK